MANTHKQRKTSAAHRRKLLLAGLFAFVALSFAFVQLNRQQTFAAVSTTYPTGRQCFDGNQQVLSADAINAITVNYYKTGSWVFFNTVTKKIEEPTIGSKGAFYWQPRKDSPVDQTVYCINGFCQYGGAYCTNWAPTLKATVLSQKEMRCFQSKDVNQMWYGWVDAQGILKPADPGTTVTLEPDLACSKHDVRGPGEWGFIEAPKDIPLPQPPASSASSRAAAVSASDKKADSGLSKLNASLINLLKKSKKK